MKMSSSDRRRLAGVRPRMVEFAERCFERYHDVIGRERGTRLRVDRYGGKRTTKIQKHLVKIGASKRLDSMHLTGRALDLIIQHRMPGVGWTAEGMWSAENYVELYEKVYKPVSDEMDYPIIWGGDWNKDGNYWNDGLFDGPHVEEDLNVHAA